MTNSNIFLSKIYVPLFQDRKVNDYECLQEQPKYIMNVNTEGMQLSFLLLNTRFFTNEKAKVHRHERTSHCSKIRAD